MYYCIVLCIKLIDCVYVLLYCIVYNMYMYILYVCLCMLQCGRTALPNTGVENYKSINQSISSAVVAIDAPGGMAKQRFVAETAKGGSCDES